MRESWQSLHPGERMLLGIAILALAFCAGYSWQIRRNYTPPRIVIEDPADAKPVQWNSDGTIIVDVAGAVHRPGVVRLPAGALTRDAIRKAGGFASGADVAAINLAAALEDGQQVYVGKPLATPTADTISGNGAAKSTFDGVIDINRATAAQLETLPGVGPKKAAAIIAHRNANGPFRRLEDLDAVKGIGPKTLEKWRDKIVIR